MRIICTWLYATSITGFAIGILPYTPILAAQWVAEKLKEA